MFLSTKHYGAEVGLSAVFRQHGASHSHCRFLHGYALAVTLVFGATRLDGRNWVVDFGALKPIKAWLQDTFDHKLMVAVDDPMRPALTDLAVMRLAQISICDAVGCEAFAKMIYEHVDAWLPEYIEGLGDGVTEVAPPQNLHLVSVEVREHGANSAVYIPGNPVFHNPVFQGAQA